MLGLSISTGSLEFKEGDNCSNRNAFKRPLFETMMIEQKLWVVVEAGWGKRAFICFVEEIRIAFGIFSHFLFMILKNKYMCVTKMWTDSKRKRFQVFELLTGGCTHKRKDRQLEMSLRTQHWHLIHPHTRRRNKNAHYIQTKPLRLLCLDGM